MAVTYIEPGEPISASDWNAIFYEQDRKLVNYTGGLSPLLTGGLNPGGFSKRKTFFFFNPSSPPWLQMHPLAQKLSLSTPPFSPPTGFLRQYDHAAIAGLVNGLTVDSATNPVPPVSDVFEVVRLTSPDVGSWIAALYPHGEYNSGTYGGISLDLCLQVMTRMIKGKPYAVTLAGGDTSANSTNGFTNNTSGMGGTGTIDRVHVWDEIELIIIGDLDFDYAWNKYNLFRIHNLGSGGAVVNFDGCRGRCVVPAGCCMCIRRDKPGGIYTQGFTYAQQMIPGDPLFFLMNFFQDATQLFQLNSGEYGRGSGTTDPWSTSSVFNPMASNAMLAEYLFSGFGVDPETGLPSAALSSDLTQFWDISRAYKDLLATPGLGSLIGDLIVPKGNFVGVRFDPVDPQTLSAWYYITSWSVPAQPAGATGYHVGQIISPAVPGQDNAHFIVDAIDGAGRFTSLSMFYPGTYNALPQLNPDGTLAMEAATGSSGVIANVQFQKQEGQETKEVAFTGFENIQEALNQLNTLYDGSHSGLLWTWNPATAVATLQLPPGSRGSFDLIDEATSLFYFLGQGDGRNNGRFNKLGYGVGRVGTGVFTFPSFAKTIVGPRRQTNTPTTTELTYHRYSVGGPQGYLRGDAVNMFLSTNNYYANDYTWNGGVGLSIQYSFMDPAQKIADALQTTNCGIRRATNFQVLATLCGPVLLWEFVCEMKAGFTPGLIDVGFGFSESKNLLIRGNQLVIRMTYFLASGYNNPWAPVDMTNAVPWHFPRANRAYIPPRSLTHNGALEPWQSNAGLYTSLENPNVKRFYDTQPAGTEEVFAFQAQVWDKYYFSRLGPIDTTPNYTSDLANDTSRIILAIWLQNERLGVHDYLRYMRAVGDFLHTPLEDPAASLTQQAVLALPMEAEHYNLVASETNSIPDTAQKITGVADTTAGTSFTLDFHSVFTVNAGTGYHAGNILSCNINPAVTLTANVVSVDSHGAITALTIVNPSVQTYGAYGTPGRPWVWTGGDGAGATFDVATGDGSNLNFIPSYNPLGVPNLGRMSIYGGTVFPKGCFFSWNGATPGGADPVADYFSGRGLGFETKLPDNYGASIEANYYPPPPANWRTIPGYILWADGFTPDFQVKMETYRWIPVDSARSFYGGLNVPFAINVVAMPQRFVVRTAEVSKMGTDYFMDPIDIFGIVATGFINDASGDWACVEWTAGAMFASAIPATSRAFAFLHNPLGLGAEFDLLDWGPLNYAAYCLLYGTYRRVFTSIIALNENQSSLAIIAVPVNYAEFDLTFIEATIDVVAGWWIAYTPTFNVGPYRVLGLGVVPIVVDNTVEGASCESNIIPGSPKIAGGTGFRVIQTGLSNANLQIFGVNNP